MGGAGGFLGGKVVQLGGEGGHDGSGVEVVAVIVVGVGMGSAVREEGKVD